MKVQTPFVVLSLTENGIRDFLFEISSSRNLFSVAEQFKDVFLFDSVSNRSFVSLNQKFGANSGGMIELKLIDVPGDFEKRFFKSGLDQLIRIAENTELDSTINSSASTAIDLTTDPEKLITEQINYAKKVRNNFSASVLYIAYGFGTNKEYWNGPSQVQLVDASLDIGSSKLITLKLQPVLKQLSTTNLANSLFKKYSMPDTKGMSLVGEGVSDIIDMSQYSKGTGLHNSSFLKNTAKIDEPGPGSLSKIDLHLLICDTIRSYLKQVCETDRVIVLLPNLNVILSDLVNSLSDTNYYPGSEVAFLEILEKVLKTLGMSLKLESSEGSPSVAAFGQVAIIGEMTAKEESKNPLEALENHFKKWKRKASIRYEITKDSMVDFKKPLFDLFNKIYQESGGKCTQPYIYYEGSLDVIYYWKKHELRQHPIFSNLPKNSNKGVVVFGDKGLITSFLIGQLNLQNKKNNASVADIPLHPLDSQILTNKTYNSSIRKMNKLFVTKDDPNFNSLYDSSFDDFSVAKSNISSDPQLYNEFAEKFKNFISNNSLPVFRYNIKNPNTKRLSHKFSPAYFSQLVMKPERDVANRIANTFVAKFITDYITFGVASNKNLLADYIIQRQLLDDSLSLEEIGNELISNVNKSNKYKNTFTEDLPNLISQVINEIQNNVNTPSVNIPQGVPITKEKLMYDFYTEMYSKTNIISVETLPFFHLNSAHIQSGCFVFADIPQPTKFGNSARTNYNQFISGYYRIVGFEHQISSNSCKSTFSLVKSLEMTNLDENDQDLNQDSFDLPDPTTPSDIALPSDIMNVGSWPGF